MKTRAVLFDLDDTLVAFDAVSEESWLEVCREYSEKRGAVAPEEMYKAIDRHSTLYWSDEERHRSGRLDIVAARRKIVSSAFKELGLPEYDSSAVADRFSKLRLEKMYLVPNAHETLDALRARQFRLALLTNGDGEMQRRKIGRFGLAKHFDRILIEGELGFGKPDRRVYERALALLGVEAEQAWMVGDNLNWDIAGPQEIGIRGIWYDWKGAGLPKETRARPSSIIRGLKELLQLLI